VIEGMRARSWGRVIVISSINGQKGQMGQVNYSAAKAGDIGFVKALAQENANKGITVNVICPGYIATDMVAAMPEEAQKRVVAGIPVGRFGSVDDISRAVVFLASDSGGFSTGATYAINGGQYMA
jgi:acetoacetyl-CoA reductase